MATHPAKTTPDAPSSSAIPPPPPLRSSVDSLLPWSNAEFRSLSQRAALSLLPQCMPNEEDRLSVEAAWRARFSMEFVDKCLKPPQTLSTLKSFSVSVKSLLDYLSAFRASPDTDTDIKNWNILRLRLFILECGYSLRFGDRVSACSLMRRVIRPSFLQGRPSFTETPWESEIYNRLTLLLTYKTIDTALATNLDEFNASLTVAIRSLIQSFAFLQPYINPTSSHSHSLSQPLSSHDIDLFARFLLPHSRLDTTRPPAVHDYRDPVRVIDEEDEEEGEGDGIRMGELLGEGIEVPLTGRKRERDEGSRTDESEPPRKRQRKK